jgi:hypothetical protein
MWQSRKSCAVVGQVHSWKLRGVVISHSFAFRASRRLKFSYNKSIENACTAFPSTLVSMLELPPPLPSLLLLRVGWLSRLNTRAIHYNNSLEVEVEVTLQLTISKSVCMSRYRGQSGTCDHITFCPKIVVRKLLSCLCGAPSLTRGRVCHLSFSVY